MVNCIYEVLRELNRRPLMYLSEPSLRALRDFYSGYQGALAFNRIRIDSEEPLFRHFGGWLERRFGTATEWSGKIVGSTKSCFTIVAEEYPDTEDAFHKFFLLLDEFQRLRKHVVGTVTLSVADQERLSDKIPGITQFLAVEYRPEKGVYWIGVRPAESNSDLGYFDSLESVLRRAESAFRIGREAWKLGTDLGRTD